MTTTVYEVLAEVWLVTGTDRAQALVARGIPGWRVWTLMELQTVLAACGSSLRTLQQAAAALQSRAHD